MMIREMVVLHSMLVCYRAIPDFTAARYIVSTGPKSESRMKKTGCEFTYNARGKAQKPVTTLDADGRAWVSEIFR